MPKYLYTTKEVSQKLKINIPYLRILARSYLHMEKFSNSYAFNKYDIKKLEAFMQENPIAKD